MKEGDTYSVKFKLAIPESIQKLGEDIVVGFANHIDMTDNNMLTSVKSETITVNENMNPDTEYTLEYTVGADDGPNNGLYLYVSYQFYNLPSGNTTTIKDPLGDVYGGVSFYEPSGFLFGSGDGSKIEDYNLFFVRDIEETTLVDSWTQTGTADDPGVNASFATFNIIKSTAPEDYQQLDKTLGYLQSCIDGKLSEDNAIRFQIESDLVITSSNNQSEALLSSLGLFANYNGMSVGENPYNFQVDTGFVGTSGFPIHLTVGGGTKNIKFNAFRTEEKSDAELKYLPRFIYVLYGTDDTTEDTSNVKHVYYTNTTTSNTTVTLVDPKTGNETKPTLTITAPAGTYKSGDLVPITITGDEYIKASADATVTINNTPYQLSDLHSSTDGKFISFLYEVKEIDSATLTVQSVTGITDFFGNDAKEVSGAPISGVELATPQMKNAVERLGVTYTDGALHFTIAAKQDEAYQNFYANNKDALMQLLITVDDGAPVTHAVTVGEDTVNNGFTFTADPYTIAPTTQEQTVTVQLQVNTGTAGTPSWVTVNRVTQTVTVDALLDVTGVTATVVDGAGQIVQPGTDDKYTVAMDEMEGKTYKLQAAFTPADATYQTGTWHSSDATIATVSNGGEGNPEAGTIQFQSQTGEVEFWFVADNGTEATEDDKESPHLTFVVTAGNSLILSIPPYAQDSLIQADKDATVSWVTNASSFYPNDQIKISVDLYAGTDATGTPVSITVDGASSATISKEHLSVTYPQSQYTVKVTLQAGPQTLEATTGITVLSPPTEMRITADKTSITDGETLELNYSINNASATGTLSATRMAGGETPDDTGNWLTATSVSGEGTVTFKPSPVSDGALYDTYTITFTEDTQAAGANFAPSTDSLVLYVYKSDALSIQSNGQDVESISLNNASEVDGAGKLPTESDDIMALRQELGLIAYVSINADAHNWSSFRDGIQWALSGDAENVAINYRQGGLWDNIEDLSYETYLPQTQMAISATADVQGVTVTATHAATGMSDTVTVNVETLQDKLYMFQATPAQVATVTYTTGKGEARTLTTNADGLLVVYEPDSIASDVQFRSGDATNPNLGTIAQEAFPAASGTLPSSSSILSTPSPWCPLPRRSCTWCGPTARPLPTRRSPCGAASTWRTTTAAKMCAWAPIPIAWFPAIRTGPTPPMGKAS